MFIQFCLVYITLSVQLACSCGGSVQLWCCQIKRKTWDLLQDRSENSLWILMYIWITEMNKSLALAFNLDSLKMLQQQIWMLTDIFTVLSLSLVEKETCKIVSCQIKTFAGVLVEEIIPNFYLYLWSCKSKKWVGDRFWQLVIKEQALLICSERNRVFYFTCQCGPGVGRGKKNGKKGMLSALPHCNLQDILAAHLCFWRSNDLHIQLKSFWIKKTHTD